MIQLPLILPGNCYDLNYEGNKRGGYRTNGGVESATMAVQTAGSFAMSLG
jgi:hypothetical protein